MRTIDLDLTQAQLDDISRLTANSMYGFARALAYLQMWSLDRYAYVSILCWVDTQTKQIEMTATYRRTKDGPIGYQIGAIWHKTTETFGFHS